MQREVIPVRREWTIEETEYLKDNWGKIKHSSIAKKMSRSTESVFSKVRRLGLGRSIDHQGYINAFQLSKLVGVCPDTVVIWIKKYGLPSKRKVTREKLLHWIIEIPAFWKWAKNNQDKWDSRKIEPLSLGPEPKWIVAKRKADLERPKKIKKLWSKEEDAKLMSLVKSGFYTQKQIGKMIGRSGNAVCSRLSRLQRYYS